MSRQNPWYEYILYFPDVAPSREKLSYDAFDLILRPAHGLFKPWVYTEFSSGMGQRKRGYGIVREDNDVH